MNIPDINQIEEHIPVSFSFNCNIEYDKVKLREQWSDLINLDQKQHSAQQKTNEAQFSDSETPGIIISSIWHK